MHSQRQSYSLVLTLCALSIPQSGMYSRTTHVCILRSYCSMRISPSSFPGSSSSPSRFESSKSTGRARAFSLANLPASAGHGLPVPKAGQARPRRFFLVRFHGRYKPGAPREVRHHLFALNLPQFAPPLLPPPRSPLPSP